MTLEVVSVADSAADAFAEVSDRAAILDEVLDEAGIEDHTRSTVGTAVHEYAEYGDGEAVRHRHRATHTVTVRLTDTGSVVSLLRRPVERRGASVRGPVWGVRDSARAEAEACREAVEDVRRRADAYAEQPGLSVGSVVSVEDEPGAPPHVPLGPVRAAATADVPLYPAEFAVAAAVDVTFQLGPR